MQLRVRQKSLMTETTTKVLFIGHDNLMREVAEVRCDFLGLFGRDMGQVHPDDRKSPPKTVLKALVNLLLGKYDLVVLPSALLARVFETNSGLKAILGRLLYYLSYQSAACWLIRKILSLLFRNCEIAFVERFSQMTIHRNFFEFFPRATLFKTIAHHSYPERPRLRIEPLPYWLNTESYPERNIPPFEERDLTLFYTGTENCKARGITNDLFAQVEEEKINFLWQKERVPLETFVDFLCRSKVAWSPEGTNWQCWRHYESLFYGAIPLINRPRGEIYHDLVHGETCLFYDSIEDAISLLKELEEGKPIISTTSEERRQFAIEKHSAAAAGRKILETYLSIKNKNRESV